MATTAMTKAARAAVTKIRTAVLTEGADQLQFPIGLLRLGGEADLQAVQAALEAEGHTITYAFRQEGFFGTGRITVIKKIPGEPKGGSNADVNTAAVS